MEPGEGCNRFPEAPEITRTATPIRDHDQTIKRSCLRLARGRGRFSSALKRGPGHENNKDKWFTRSAHPNPPGGAIICLENCIRRGVFTLQTPRVRRPRSSLVPYDVGVPPTKGPQRTTDGMHAENMLLWVIEFSNRFIPSHCMHALRIELIPNLVVLS